MIWRDRNFGFAALGEDAADKVIKTIELIFHGIRHHAT
jgi:hypothetical protein